MGCASVYSYQNQFSRMFCYLAGLLFRPELGVAGRYFSFLSLERVEGRRARGSMNRIVSSTKQTLASELF